MRLPIDSPSIHVEATSCLIRSEIYCSLSPRALFIAHKLRLRGVVFDNNCMSQTMREVFMEEFVKSSPKSIVMVFWIDDTQEVT